ncbi:MAG: ABC transporter permease [Propionibacteriaceae bacterium]|jgi:inositol transport system permease protein|nr:ABC transporter permease [Propionibacteriaceae bacterium]
MKLDVKRLNLNRFSIFLILLAMFVIATLLSPNFLSQTNLINILQQVAVTVFLTYGAMMLIVGGMLDLSAGSVLALSGVFAVVTYKATNNMVLAVGVAILLGVACNLVNALMVANFDAPPFIATLAMSMAARGAVLLYTKGQNVLQLGRFKFLGQGTIGPIPVPVVFMFFITAIIGYVMTQTKLGRSLYAIGGNQLAARASGINVTATKYKAYAINGVLVGFAGAVFMSRVNAGLPNGAVGYEMEGLTAAIVGGTSFTGGIGTTLGALAGALIIGLLNNIMNLTGVDSYVQQIAKGLIIAVAVIWDIHSRKGRRTRVILKEATPSATTGGTDSARHQAGSGESGARKNRSPNEEVTS